ncbi:LRR repeats and ubiquitin-like domain-containing protein At2g30105 isoform X1 [Coffea arabica]|uniref:LRR repeats and ubiquitin-like domain-containing protein At2g30105 isoform X1 n=2 Tax=Coffea arabica TaxID=13443 RepID=A0A6P6W8L0_COFAR|nr:LRR repeats and ubiquitin-like domain-containing protein At2g30105 isoform X1 [Coffea arabica]
MEAGKAAGTDSGEESRMIKVNVKFGGRSIPVEIPLDSTVRDLKSILQPLTNVLPRGQKFIFKGKVLVDEMTMRSSEIINGSKIMLMATQGLHQGDGPIKQEAPAIEKNLRRRTSELLKANKEVSVPKSQLERWKATGVIALSECNLKAIPEEVWMCGPSARLLDLSHNSLLQLPDKIACLSSMQKLLLNANDLSDKLISWEGLTSLKSLTILSLNQNCLAVLPSAIGALTSLRQLLVENNKLTCLPTEIGLLTNLQILKAANNRINDIPASIGECISLVEVDLSSNLLVELPETFGNLKDLKALYTSNNGLRSLPSTLFKMCSQLSILDLHGTEVTMDVLRQFEGWDDFDNRRRLKHQKQLDFRVAGSAEFDEGADKRY